MAREQRTPPSPARAASRPAQAFESIALYGLLLIVAMRPLVSETYNSALTAIDRATGVVGASTPATTAAFDLAILGCGLLTAVGRALRRERWRWTGLEIGWLLMLAGAAVSTCAAGNKRLALNASADWLITALLVFIFADLCRTRWRVALVLIIVVASGLTSLARSGLQITQEFPETRQHYFENKAEFWAQQGVPLDDPRVALFERRILGTAATGFFPHSNVQAALLSLCGFSALGLAALSWKNRPIRTVCILLGAGLLAGTIMTASKGGVLAALIGLALLGAAWTALPRFPARWRTLWWAAWALVGAGGAAVILVGAVRGGLPGASLQFRWEYWKVTRQIIADHPWTGTGALNFDRAYLLHKPIEYPEEIKDPHNFVLSVLAQWGLLGGAGLMWMLIAGSYRTLRAIGAVAGLPDAASSNRPNLVRWSAALIVGFLLLRWILMSGFWLAGQTAIVLYDLELYGLIWSATLGGLVWLLFRDGPSEVAPDERTLDLSFPRMRLVLLCGTAAFLLHNVVEFAILYPGTLTPFAALAGLLLGPPQREAGDQSASRRETVCVAATAILVPLLFLWLVFVPVTRASAWLSDARAAESPQQAERSLRAAMAADPFDPTPPAELAGLYAQYGQPRPAVDSIGIALDRDPTDADLHKLSAMAHELSHRAAHDPDELHAAIRSARMALSLYPASPDGHLALADLLARSAQALGATQLAAEAAQAYQRALDLDAARPGADEVRRWSPERRHDIEQRIRSVQAAASVPATATSPAP